MNFQLLISLLCMSGGAVANNYQSCTEMGTAANGECQGSCSEGGCQCINAEKFGTCSCVSHGDPPAQCDNGPPPCKLPGPTYDSHCDVGEECCHPDNVSVGLCNNYACVAGGDPNHPRKKAANGQWCSVPGDFCRSDGDCCHPEGKVGKCQPGSDWKSSKCVAEVADDKKKFMAFFNKNISEALSQQELMI
eukprot:gnl/MRDRNA2_/MRDRNA2_59723_c0_seq2.p1 gnl/MRDRNA2_/MRDRNA2_59723_c0~~gnl/MRDRNA2_/MRDRNA2_59723_c0_seq2.p1  ORF type:complete len:215 (-),score=27.79 gnl/MRDRNA2_/MRDRNA2_59723_c0_seq2:190-762(-)